MGQWSVRGSGDRREPVQSSTGEAVNEQQQPPSQQQQQLSFLVVIIDTNMSLISVPSALPLRLLLGAAALSGISALGHTQYVHLYRTVPYDACLKYTVQLSIS